MHTLTNAYTTYTYINALVRKGKLLHNLHIYNTHSHKTHTQSTFAHSHTHIHAHACTHSYTHTLFISDCRPMAEIIVHQNYDLAS